ncbi:membrane protein [Roseibium aquae]|uniref:Membrane protein n=1 Tax=Roseibium aquae TaxID=1323746 RepID=A0A916X057_9HYPH|nr:M23 family metallopeptidase [Roseibium aquae]GGB44240.1 membrane protein [Roseibium aquae]
MVTALCAIMGVAMLGTGLATYFFMKSDLVAISSREKDALELQYQDRIDRLRTEIERLTSRQMVDRESVELKVMEIVRRQQAIARQHDLVTDLMDRAERSGIRIAAATPSPPEKPVVSEFTSDEGGFDPLLAIGGEPEPLVDPLKILGLRGSSQAPSGAPSTDQPPALVPHETLGQGNSEIDADKKAALDEINDTLMAMDRNSAAALDALALAAEQEVETLVSAITPLGVDLDKAVGISGLAAGGPFIPYTGTGFDHRVRRASLAMEALDDLKDAAGRLPIHRPVRHVSISSDFGPRLDPFLNRWAMHSGIDFRASHGTRVYAAAPGTVVHAGWSGGYGKMVEIEHANGYVTRYAHLSRLQVKTGNHVLTGDVIGNIGSTGRSTGPHLHYELHEPGGPVDPAHFIGTGDRLASLLRRR